MSARSASKSYSEKLKDPRWQKLRLRALEEADWTCQACGETKLTLHVHHGYYARGREPWETEDGLWVLCEPCHLWAEKFRLAGVRLLGLIRPCRETAPLGLGMLGAYGLIERGVGPEFAKEFMLIMKAVRDAAPGRQKEILELVRIAARSAGSGE